MAVKARGLLNTLKLAGQKVQEEGLQIVILQEEVNRDINKLTA